MSLHIPISQHLIDVKYRVLKSLLMTTSIAMIVVALINIFNQRPLINIFMPFLTGLLMIALYKISYHIKYRRIIKFGFMIFLTNIYLPMAWLTSPGSFSAMSFYSVLLIFISLILAERYWEFLIPFIGLLEMILLLSYEPLHTEQYQLYAPMNARAIDLCINFSVVIITLFIISLTLNRYFDDEHQKLFKTSITDPLTKVFNRRYLFQRLEEVHFIASKYGTTFTLLMIDINHFKQINDTYGHNIGDQILSELGTVLIHSSRNQDIPARFGGDEFILLLPDTNYEQASIVAERITTAFKPTCEQYADIFLDLAIGITENHNLEISAILQLADEQLYKHKREMK